MQLPRKKLPRLLILDIKCFRDAGDQEDALKLSEVGLEEMEALNLRDGYWLKGVRGGGERQG